jgi:hypothetical protein
MSLGVILTPYGHTPGFPPSGIAYNFKGARNFETPFDPQWYRRGEAGYYYDSELGGLGKPSGWQRLKAKLGLGAIPTDFEIAKQYGYLPVYSGWVTTNQGYQSGGWNPPHGRWPGYPTSIAPKMAPLNGLGLTEVEPGPMSIDDFVSVQQAQNDRVFALTAVSTVAVTISALIGLFRTIKLIKEDK